MKLKKRDWSGVIIIEGLILVVLLATLVIENLLSLNEASTFSFTRIKSLPLSVVLASRSAELRTASPSAEPVAVAPVNYGNSVHVPILMYHYIGNNPNPADLERNVLETTPDKFDEQMGYLASAGYTPITFDSMYAALKQGGSLPTKPVILTFDDGYVDFYLNAFPILKKYNFHAVSFIPTGLIGGSYYMNWNQIQEIQTSGLISFEAHSVSHADLPALSPMAQEYQITQSKKDLEAHLGVPVNFFAYPYGASNSISRNLVKQAGFVGAVGTWYGTNESEGTQYDWPRVRINGGISLDQYKRLF